MRPALAHDLRERDAAHVWHGHICQECGHIVPHFQDGDSLNAIARFNDVVPGLLQEVGKGHPDENLILNDENNERFGFT